MRPIRVPCVQFANNVRILHRGLFFLVRASTCVLVTATLKGRDYEPNKNFKGLEKKLIDSSSQSNGFTCNRLVWYFSLVTASSSNWWSFSQPKLHHELISSTCTRRWKSQITQPRCLINERHWLVSGLGLVHTSFGNLYWSHIVLWASGLIWQCFSVLSLSPFYIN